MNLQHISIQPTHFETLICFLSYCEGEPDENAGGKPSSHNANASSVNNIDEHQRELNNL